MELTEEQLRYPIGKYEPAVYSVDQFNKWVTDIRNLPQQLENAITNLNEDQLHTAYRPGGWTVHQVVHHVADSHMNALIRFKLGLTENKPTIKPYDEEAWALLPDTNALPVNISLTLLHSLHSRFYQLVKNLDQETLLNRSIIHPAKGQEMSLWYVLGMYSWHGKHHTAHIRQLRDIRGW